LVSADVGKYRKSLIEMEFPINQKDLRTLLNNLNISNKQIFSKKIKLFVLSLQHFTENHTKFGITPKSAYII